MTRSAPGAERVVALLNFLSAHPGQSFGASELARRLSFSKATLLSMLGSLVDAGYLLRHPTSKAYSLGPALIAVGSAAARQFAPVDYALDEMRLLSEELGVQCVAGAVVAGEIVMLARTGEPRPFGTSVSPGQRLPLAPPLGTVYLAWASPDDIDAWLDKLGPDATTSQRQRFLDALGAVRERGFAIGLEAVAKLRLSQALSALPGDAGPERLREIVEGLVAELEHEESVLSEFASSSDPRQIPPGSISHLSAPVFGSDGHVVLAMNLIDLPRDLPPVEIDRYARKLCDAAYRVTKAIGGRQPER